MVVVGVGDLGWWGLEWFGKGCVGVFVFFSFFWGREGVGVRKTCFELENQQGPKWGKRCNESVLSFLVGVFKMISLLRGKSDSYGDANFLVTFP